LSGIEVKRDPRDGAYKLIEINARFGLWDSLGRRCGVDLPLIAYHDLTTGRTVRRRLPYRTGVKWIYLANDLRALLYYRKEGTLGVKKWLCSLRGEKDWALLSLADPVPAVRTFLHMAGVALRHLAKRQLVGRLAADVPSAFVLGASPNGLSFIRSLGRKGISVIALDSVSSPGLYSRYCEGVALPEIEDNEKIWLEFLIERGKKLSCKAVLIPTGDAHVLLVSRNRELLSQYFNFSLPEKSVVEAITSKRTQYGLAKQWGVAIPETHYPEDVSEVESLSDSVSYPCILKPYYSHLWQKHSPKRKEYKMVKLAVVDDPEELVETYGRMARSGIGILVQERIPGEDTDLFSFLTYCGEDSEPMVLFTKRKLRQTQAGYGDGCFQESAWEPTVARLGSGLLRRLKWRGLACLEFKKDMRDGRFKLIEVNPRSFTGVDMAVKSGVDLPDIAYRDIAGHEVRRISTFSEGVKWMHLTWDFAATLLHKQERRITFTEWLKSLRGQKSFAIWSSDDPLPFIMLLVSALRRLCSRLLCRLKRREQT
jgi:predicted ATP-grasp superfamily ATP-dependent carboligase